jgi:hypothetical protein
LPDGVNSAVKGVEAVALQPMIDCVRAQAEFHQLRSRDHPILALRETRHRLVVTTLTFAAYMAVKVSGVAHAREDGARRVTAG